MRVELDENQKPKIVDIPAEIKVIFFARKLETSRIFYIIYGPKKKCRKIKGEESRALNIDDGFKVAIGAIGEQLAEYDVLNGALNNAGGGNVTFKNPSSIHVAPDGITFNRKASQKPATHNGAPFKEVFVAV